jgi:hypothetical protein
MEGELDCLHDAVEILIHLRIPEPKRAEPCPAEDGVAHGVVSHVDIIAVLTSIHLDDKPLPEADKVQIEAEQRRLPAEMEAVGAHGSQLEPNPNLLARQSLAQFAGALGRCSILPHPADSARRLSLPMKGREG